MRVRNNTGRDFELTFKVGHGLRLSRGEISREITSQEMTDPWFTKALDKRKVVKFKEPTPPAPKPEKKPMVPDKPKAPAKDSESPKARKKSSRKPRRGEE